MKPWPRPFGPETIDGPLRMCHGPKDFEGSGREAFWDQTPEERKAALSAMVRDANLDTAARVDLRYFGVANESKAYARGWLNELERVRSHAPKK